MTRVSNPSCLAIAASALLLTTIGCSDAGTGGGSGGVVATSGGASSGGATSGGASSGGATSGGASSGGATTGGASAGGASAGGAASGGAASGGTDAGGSPAGGAPSGGGPGDGGGPPAGGAGTGGGGGGGDFKLTSAELVEGMTMPELHTCDSKMGFMNWGIAPSLKWENPPEGTMSYAFFVIDWTLTMGTAMDQNGYHSAAWNIPTTITEVELGWMAADLTGAKSINGAYLGPCPPNGPDTYHLIIMALPMASYTITGSGTGGVKTAYNTLKDVALDVAEITATYKKK